MGATELIVIGLIVVLLFGASKLPELGRAVGEGVSNLKRGLREANDDGTLTSACGLSRSAPVRVSVLYLQSPRRGGALRLHRLLGPATEVTPVEGTLVHFRGDLVHSVATVDEGLRISLVMEQYALDDAALARVPRCQLASEGHFDRVLAGARDRL